MKETTEKDYKKFNKGIKLAKKGKYEAALLKLLSVKTKYNTSHNLYKWLGYCRMKLTDYKGAYLEFKEALKLTEYDPESEFGIAYCLYKAGHHNKAHHWIQKSRYLKPNMYFGDFDFALDFLWNLDNSNADMYFDYDIRMCLAEVYEHQENYKKAIEIYHGLIKDDRDNYPLFGQIAKWHYYLKQYSDAIQICSLLIDKIPSKEGNYDLLFDDGYLTRGMSKKELKDYEGAIEDFMVVISNCKGDNYEYFAFWELAESFQKLGKYHKAIDFFSKIIFHQDSWFYLNDPNTELATAYYNRGICKMNLNKKEEALEDFTMANTIKNLKSLHNELS